MSGFLLDPRLAADSVFVADGPVSQLRLMDDARFHWLVLVPRLAEARELVDLDAGVQARLLEEINQACHLLRACAPCDKLNIGALGNIVRQLHVHVLARVEGDAAWPGPVWGAGSMQRLDPADREQRLQDLRAGLQPANWVLPRA
jgi:diadenosine tetraphosphate (Ap4A) HIT family hydrolase